MTGTKKPDNSQLGKRGTLPQTAAAKVLQKPNPAKSAAASALTQRPNKVSKISGRALKAAAELHGDALERLAKR